MGLDGRQSHPYYHHRGRTCIPVPAAGRGGDKIGSVSAPHQFPMIIFFHCWKLLSRDRKVRFCCGRSSPSRTTRVTLTESMTSPFDEKIGSAFAAYRFIIICCPHHQWLLSQHGKAGRLDGRGSPPPVICVPTTKNRIQLPWRTIWQCFCAPPVPPDFPLSLQTALVPDGDDEILWRPVLDPLDQPCPPLCCPGWP